ncbi:hypothetical protein Tco_0816449, partial [Tanacetum coccineum]
KQTWWYQVESDPLTKADAELYRRIQRPLAAVSPTVPSLSQYQLRFNEFSTWLTSDEFGEVCLPDSLVHTNGLAISKVYESLGLFKYYDDGDISICDVWIMKESVTKSFTKMLSIKAPDSWVRYRVLELRKNGEAIIENIDDTNSSVLEVYEPSSG